jgi:hypothetical protein
MVLLGPIPTLSKSQLPLSKHARVQHILQAQLQNIQSQLLAKFQNQQAAAVKSAI